MNEAARDLKIESTALQIRKIGNSVGVILPKELLARLNLKEGDKFYPVEQPDGSLRLSPFNPSMPGRWKLPARSCTNIAIRLPRSQNERANLARCR